jgi:hypothetical protein
MAVGSTIGVAFLGVGHMGETHLRNLALLQSFFQDLQAGRKPSPGPEDALETLRLAIAVTKSWRESRPVKVSEIQ